MRRIVQLLMSLGLAVMIIGGPFAYRAYQRSHFRNFRTVRPGVLYRSGQLSLAGLQRICHDHGIRTVITLRETHDPSRPHPDWAEEQWCRKMDVFHFRLPPKCWWSPDGTVPAEENVRKFCEIMDDPRHHPVLIHCFAGAHRTGAFCCIFRMEYDRWPAADALRELFECGYENIHLEDDVRGYLSQYQPRWANLKSGNREPIEEQEPGNGEPRTENRE